MGISINTEKTNVARIGDWGDNRTISCKTLDLDWSQKFIPLGIEYDVDNLENNSDLNIEVKIKENQKLICIWSARNSTLYGKITIMKSLLISKITHALVQIVLLSWRTCLRNSYGTKNSLKFRREILENPTELGGLKLTNIDNF